ncbi:MAG: bifunctional phosphoglucose/phosphomannose isomerase [Candidatus Limnocylindrales bacterium]
MDERDLPTGPDVLDDGFALARLDPADMRGQVARISTQVREAWAQTRSLTLPAAHRGARAIAALGMGGSAIGADLVAGIFEERLRVPLAVVRDYDLPAWVGPETLVVASSYSGATEETLSALEEALRRRCPVVVITTGGPLLEVARRAELPFLAFPCGGQPRASIGYGLALLAGLLERAGFLDLPDDEVAAATTTAERAAGAVAPSVPTVANLAKQLAWSLVDRAAVIEASTPLAAVARRWKTQLNENAKSAASFEVLPEATHNAVVGYAHPDAAQERTYVVFLSARSDHARTRLRGDLSGELLYAAHVPHRTVLLEGPSRLAQALHGIVLGDATSVYLAALYGEDPTPVEALSGIKARLAAASSDEDD